MPRRGWLITLMSGRAATLVRGFRAVYLGLLFNCVIMATVKEGVDPARVEAIIDEELERLVNDGPTAQELAQARTVVRAGFIRGVERIGGFGGAPGGAAQPRGLSGAGFGYGPELLDEMTTTKVVHLGLPG